jgi:regulator of protease activity HflC (stomatin/prohibitin superfamily)
MYVFPKYRIYKQDLRGQAELREKEWTKKVLVEEAKAERDSASLYAEASIVKATGWANAEVERAKGVAEANEIIGESLKENEEYLKYLWVKGLQDGSSEVIYIPTEANMPILEAGKR